jgi:hypothetical protein
VDLHEAALVGLGQVREGLQRVQPSARYLHVYRHDRDIAALVKARARLGVRAPPGGPGELHSAHAGAARAPDRAAEGRARRYLLTFAAGAFPDFLAKTEREKVPYGPLHQPGKRASALADTDYTPLRELRARTAGCVFGTTPRSGVMFWEYFADASGELLGALHDELNAKPR